MADLWRKHGGYGGYLADNPIVGMSTNDQKLHKIKLQEKLMPIKRVNGSMIGVKKGQNIRLK